jgi:hypothetical protein
MESYLLVQVAFLLSEPLIKLIYVTKQFNL